MPGKALSRAGGLPVAPSVLLGVFGAFLVSLIVALSALALWQLRERSLANAERELANLNHVLAEHTARAVQHVDLLLQSTIEWIGPRGPGTLGEGPAVHESLRARIDGVPQVRALMIIAPDGSISDSSRSFPPPRVSLADLPYYIKHRDTPGSGLEIEAPRKSRVDGKWSLYLSRALRGPRGEFGGVVSALVDPAYFEEFYRLISLGEGSAVALFRSDGVLLTRYPFSEEWMGRSFSHGDVYTKILARSGRGVVRTHSVVDDVDRIISGQRLSAFPLAVNVSLTQDVALQEWRNWAAFIVAGAGASILVLGGLLVVLARQFRRHDALHRELASSEAHLNEAQRIAKLGSWSFHPGTGRQEWSRQTFDIYGVSERHGPLHRDRFPEFVHEADVPHVQQFIEDACNDGKGRGFEFRVVRPHGEVRWVEMMARPVLDPQGRVARVDGTVMDVTERRANEEKLRLAASVFERSAEANMVVDRQGRIVSVNQAFSRITGYAEAEVLGRSPRLLASGRHARPFYRQMWTALARSGHWEGEIWNRRKNGEVFPERMSVAAAHDGKGAITHYIAIFSDISERKAAEERIQNLAYYDPLTGLPNRSLLKDRAERALGAAQRARDPVAILFIDLDRFKNINDSLGHHAGDLVLQQVAERLTNCVGEADTVARQGGDEFILILPGTDAQGAAGVACKIIDALSPHLSVMGRELTATPSIGVAIFPDDGHDADTLIKNADAAMYHAKASGRANYQFFREEMNARAFELLAMEGSLRRALERGEFFLAYQPQVALASGRIVGAEALLRWRHPAMGEVLPERFIRFAEDNGLIVAIGEWVLREACRQAAAWRDAGLPRIRVAINLSAAQFRQSDFGDTLREVLAQSGLPPHCLELEVTEHVLMNDADGVIGMLQGLKALGIGLAVDDFGTGYSSLSYLRLFPIDKLKIDQSFVRDISLESNDGAIIRSIIGLGKHFHLSVIAEGVETAAQLAFLRSAGCDEVQGFCCSSPVSAEAFAQLLGSGPLLQGWTGPLVEEAA